MSPNPSVFSVAPISQNPVVADTALHAAADAWTDPKIEYIRADISDRDAVVAACKGAECVWHLAAAVGPYHPEELYTKVP